MLFRSNQPVHTVREGNVWVNKREGSNTVESSYATQKEAVAAGRKLAQREHTEHLVHGRNGEIRSRDSYGNDPFPPRG